MPIRNEDVTFVVKTHDRPRMLLECLDSILQHSPGSPIVIIDDGDAKANIDVGKGMLHYYVEADIGISAGRNLGVDMSTTSHVFIADDDFIFSEFSELLRLYSLMSTGVADFMGIRALHPKDSRSLSRFTGVLFQLYGQLHGVLGFNRIEPTWKCCDCIQNCFIAKRQTLQEFRWDPELLLCEHWDFFWRAKHEGLVVGRMNDGWLNHPLTSRLEYPNYVLKRDERSKCRHLAMRKHNLASIRLFGHNHDYDPHAN